MDMHMSFWFGIKLDNFLFKGLDVNSWAGLAAVCFALSAAAVAFEGLKVLHSEAKLKTLSLSSHVRHKHSSPADGDLLLGNNLDQVRIQKLLSYFLEVSLYVVQVVLGYFFMLAVMTYNVYISLAILLGVAIGYSLFGQLLMDRRLKNARFAIPCQNCTQDEDKEAVDTVAEENESSSGCCSRTQPEESATELLD